MCDSSSCSSNTDLQAVKESLACYLQPAAMAAVANPEQGLDADERIAIVDETNNEVVGSARRAEMVRASLGERVRAYPMVHTWASLHMFWECFNASTTRDGIYDAQHQYAAQGRREGVAVMTRGVVGDSHTGLYNLSFLVLG